MKLDLFGLIAYLGTITVGVGGALGAVALDADDLAFAVLTGVVGLLIPAPKLLTKGEHQ